MPLQAAISAASRIAMPLKPLTRDIMCDIMRDIGGDMPYPINTK